MPEFNITGWLDPALDYFARQTGISVSDYSSQFGGEAYGNALEAMADLFTIGWLNKAIQFGAGVFASSYAIWGAGLSPRFRKEFLALGTHELFRFIDPKPSDIVEMKESMARFSNAISRGDWNAVLASGLRPWADVQAMMGFAPQPTPAPAPSVSPPPATATVPALPPTHASPPALPPAPTATRSRYTVTKETPVVGTAARSRYVITG
jgi:hypothetical protein